MIQYYLLNRHSLDHHVSYNLQLSDFDRKGILLSM